jgi:hypothetical protein
MTISIKIEAELSVGLPRIFGLVNDVAGWSVFDRPRVLNAKNGKISLAFEDLTRAFIDFKAEAGLTKIRIVHELLKSEADIHPRELYWEEVLAGFRRRVELA